VLISDFSITHLRLLEENERLH